MTVIPTIYGDIEAPNWDDDLIVRSLSIFGEWSYCEQLILSQIIRANDAIWDGGAFLGTFGIGVARLACALGHPPSRLVAVEPSRILDPYLRANLTRNAPCPFDVASAAISKETSFLCPDDTDKEQPDLVDQNHGALSYRYVEEAGKAGAVQGLPLMELRRLYGDYDVIKLDIEGMESDALIGDAAYISARQPVIWAECNEAENSIHLLEVMVSLGYQPQYVAFPAFRADNFRGSGQRFFPMAFEAALLAAPVDRMPMILSSKIEEEIIHRAVSTAWDLRQAMWATPRWALEEWADLSRPELVALLGRLYRGEVLERFLTDAEKIPSG
jgi:FkbM family methyltransferase